MRGNFLTALELTQNSILRINDKKTLELIEEYKKEECLWNTTLPDYPNREKRVKAANRIAKILQIPNFEGRHVMIKFKNLRNSYCQELKKIAHSMSAAGSDDSAEVYKPKVQWFSSMDSFIRPHLQSSRPAVIPVSFTSFERQPEEPEVTGVKMEFYESDGQEDWSIPMKDNNIRAETSYSISEQGHSENDELSNDSRTKKRRLSNTSRSGEQYNHERYTFSPDQVDKKIEDTYDNFGKYIASLLRTLPPEKALRLQPKIVNMIVEVGVSAVQPVEVMIERLDDDDVLE